MSEVWINKLCSRFPGKLVGEPASVPLRTPGRPRCTCAAAKCRVASGLPTDRYYLYSIETGNSGPPFHHPVAAPCLFFQPGNPDDQFGPFYRQRRLHRHHIGNGNGVAPYPFQNLRIPEVRAGRFRRNPVNVAPGAYRTGSDPAAPFATLPPPVPAGSTTAIDLSIPSRFCRQLFSMPGNRFSSR